MSFKFFRKHQKAMLWVTVVITVLLFSVFSVTSTMRTCFRQDQEDPYVATFTSKTGDTVKITRQMLEEARTMRRKFFRDQEISFNMLLGDIVLAHEAEEANIDYTESEFRNFLLNDMGLGAMIDTPEKYKQYVKLHHMSVREFETGYMHLLKVDKFKRMFTRFDDVLFSEELYDNYKLENEEFKLAFVSFDPASYEEKIDKEAITEEVVKTYYDGLDEKGQEVVDNFSEAKKVEFDLLYLNLDEINPEDYKDVIATEPFEEVELLRYYNSTRERFLIEPTEEDKDKEEKPGDAPGDDPAKKDTTKVGDEEEETPKQPEYKDFTEVKAELEIELKYAKLVEKANEEWNKYGREKGIFGKKWEDVKKEQEEEDAKAENEEKVDKDGEPIKENEDKAEEESASDQDLDPDAFIDMLAAKYHLLRDKVTGPVSFDDVPDIEKYGSLQLQTQLTFLQVNHGAYLRPNKTRPNLAMFIRITEVVERSKKPFEAVADLAKVHYIIQQKKDMAKADADGFYDNLMKLARADEEAAEGTAEIEKQAAKNAEEIIKSKEVEPSAEEKEEIQKQELAKFETEIDQLAQPYLHKHFDAQAELFKTPLNNIDYFSKRIRAEQDFQKLEDSPVKFLKSNNMVFQYDTNSVIPAFENPKTNLWYLVHVIDRKFPEPSVMTAKNYKEHRQRETVKRQWPANRNIRLTELRNKYFDYPNLQKEYDIKVTEIESTTSEEDDKKEGVGAQKAPDAKSETKK